MPEPDPFVFPGYLFVPGLLGAAILVAMGLYFAVRPPRPNPWAGMRLSWTYADKGIWYETQRLTGWLLLASGVGFVVWLPVAMALLIGMAVVGIVYARGRYLAKYGTTKVWRGPKGMGDYRPVAKCANCGHLNELERGAELALTRCEMRRHSLARQ